MVKGVLLVNLGSPAEPTTKAVKKYLRQFLMDPYVIDIPWALRFPLVQGIIAPFRAPKSAHAYQSVWRTEGSPLIHFSQSFAAKVREKIDANVALGMRYGEPSIRKALEDLKKNSVSDLKVVPLYPQFAMSSTYTAIHSVMKELDRMQWRPLVHFLRDFFAESEWTRSIADQITKENESFKAQYLLFSYHGLPEHHVTQFDRTEEYCLKLKDCCEQVRDVNMLCYRAQCFATTRAAVKELGWTKDKYSVSFQSRLGSKPWIKPYSDIVVPELAKNGVKRLLVACPSFVADCLETLEEVAIRLRDDFKQAGGEDLRLVPAVNDTSLWVDRFTKMIQRHDLAWLNSEKAIGLLNK